MTVKCDDLCFSTHDILPKKPLFERLKLNFLNLM